MSDLLHTHVEAEPIDNHDETKEKFLSSTILLNEGQTLPCSLICIDERAKILDGEGNVIFNFPGGGFEYVSDEDIDKVLRTSDGKIVLIAHNLCGWGQITFKDLIINSENNEGRQRVTRAIWAAINDKGFQDAEKNKKDSLSPDGIEDVIKDTDENVDDLSPDEISAFVEAEHKLLHLDRKNYADGSLEDFGFDSKAEELYLKAFAYGEMLFLKERILARARENYKDREFTIEVKLDNLEGEPHTHIANDAIINLTQRVFLERPEIKNNKVFVADINIDRDNQDLASRYARMVRVSTLMFAIMEGDHSDTRAENHTINIFCKEEDKVEIEELIEKITQNNENRKIQIFTLTEEELKRQNDPLPPRSGESK